MGNAGATYLFRRASGITEDPVRSHGSEALAEDSVSEFLIERLEVSLDGPIVPYKVWPYAHHLGRFRDISVATDAVQQLGSSLGKSSLPECHEADEVGVGVDRAVRAHRSAQVGEHLRERTEVATV